MIIDAQQFVCKAMATLFPVKSYTHMPSKVAHMIRHDPFKPDCVYSKVVKVRSLVIDSFKRPNR